MAHKSKLQPVNAMGYEMSILAARFSGAGAADMVRVAGSPMTVATVGTGVYTLNIPGDFNNLIALHLQIAGDDQNDADLWRATWDVGSLSNANGVISVTIESTDGATATDLPTDMDLSVIAVVSDSSLNLV